MRVKQLFRSPLIWIAFAALALLLGSNVLSSHNGSVKVDTWKVISDIEQGRVTVVTLIDKEQTIQATLTDGTKESASYIAGQGAQLANLLKQKKAEGKLPNGYNIVVPRQSLWVSLLVSILPVLLIVGLWIFLMSQMQGGGRIMSFGKSRAKLVTKDMPQTTFADVAGADEAVEELQEIKEFLQEPAKFQALGAKIPKGVLLYGPPGTGKTLLAKAIAGEAKVPFFSISGSDFVEMFVGVGASRVRDLFDQAKQNAPAIIFVDEIDAVGRHRGAGLGGGHDEREQTLNQMLVEMDGFDANTGVILIAATNRPDILDPALLRPGRFDRQVSVGVPDLQGRHDVLAVHAKGKPLDEGVDLMAVARRTPGFTGADLANVLNEAGPQKRTRVMSEHERLITAYHEGGHALVAAALPNTDPVHKITILPRGRALGYTMVLPESDKYSTTRSEMLDQLAYMLGGRAAEELIFHDPTTGASNDIEKATAVARKMVTEFGMTERLGAVKYGQSSGEVFMGRDMGHQRDYSEEVAAAIDEEVRAFIDVAHHEAFDILVTNRDVLDALVLELLEKETLDREQVARIFEPLSRRPRRPAWTGSPRRTPSERPPVAVPSANVAQAIEAPASEESASESTQGDV